MAYKFNPLTGQLDLVGLSTVTADDIYLRLDTTNDPLTGDLTAPFYTATSSGLSTFNGNVFFKSGLKIKSGQKLIFDA